METITSINKSPEPSDSATATTSMASTTMDTTMDTSTAETSTTETVETSTLETSTAITNDNNNTNNDSPQFNNNKNDGDNNSISNNNFNSDELTTPEVVVEQLKTIAESGTVHIDWLDLQRALKLRLGNVLDHYIERNRDSAKEEQYQEPNVENFNLEHSRNELLELISSFSEAPFTIQRICELLYTPFKYYDKISTFLRGLEKNLRVISPVTWPKNQIEPPATKTDNS